MSGPVYVLLSFGSELLYGELKANGDIEAGGVLRMVELVAGEEVHAGEMALVVGTGLFLMLTVFAARSLCERGLTE